MNLIQYLFVYAIIYLLTHLVIHCFVFKRMWVSFTPIYMHLVTSRAYRKFTAAQRQRVEAKERLPNRLQWRRYHLLHFQSIFFRAEVVTPFVKD